MNLGVGEIARLLNVDRTLLKQWSFHFKEYLSSGANPQKGTSRQFTLLDLQVLMYVCEYWEEQPDIESLKIGLNCGNHLDLSIYKNMLTSWLPIFQQPHENLDETWQHVFLVGGMCENLVDEFTLAESFKLAGDILVESALSNDEHCEILYPIMYNYRHSVELYLKAVLPEQKEKHHNLQILFKELNEILKNKNVTVIPDWFKNLVYEFHDFDPNSTTFRFSESGVFSKITGDKGEFMIDLQHIKKLMSWFSQSLQRIRYLQIAP